MQPLTEPAATPPSESTPAGTRESPRQSTGRLRLWVPLLFLVGATAWGLESLEEHVDAADFTTVDMHRSRLVPVLDGFSDPRWEAELARTLAQFPAPDVHDQEALARIGAAVARLSFVAEASEPRVIWPDGFEVPVRLREPVACAHVGGSYLLVAADGMVLPGAWTDPPHVAGRSLPRLGPEDAALERLRPGTRLVEARHLDALALAVSMKSGLSNEDAELLGTLRIDASKARVASVEEPGTRLELENGRTVLFGRAPGTREPGELPVELKWRSVSKAAELLRERPDQPARDWAVVDVRWDTPAIRMRTEVAAGTR